MQTPLARILSPLRHAARDASGELSERLRVDAQASGEILEALATPALVAPLASGNEVRCNVAPAVSMANDVVDADVVSGSFAGTITGVFGEGTPAPHALAGFAVAPPSEKLHAAGLAV